jgi:hypothetical protein
MPHDPAKRPRRSSNPIDAAREAFSELIGESPRQVPHPPDDEASAVAKRKAEPSIERREREQA